MLGQKCFIFQNEPIAKQKLPLSAQQDVPKAEWISRSFTSNDLGQLMEREAQLKAIVARERAAEKVAAGLGDPRSLFVRFGR